MKAPMPLAREHAPSPHAASARALGASPSGGDAGSRGASEAPGDSGGAGRELQQLVGEPLNVKSLALSVISVLLVVHALHIGQEFFFPILFALLASVTLTPLLRMLGRLQIPEPVGAALIVLGLVVSVGAAMTALAEPAAEWIDRTPSMLRELRGELYGFRASVSSVGRAAEEIESLADPDAAGPKVKLQQESLLGTLAVQTRSVVVTAGIVLVLLYFLLATGDAFLRKIVSILPRFEDKRAAVSLLRRVESDIARYLLTVTCVNLGLGAAVALAMAALGMPTPALWGLMAAAFNFVPFIGAAASAVILSGAALMVHESIWSVFAVVGVFAALTCLEGLVVTPALLGRGLSLSPVLVLVSLLFWSWLWGVAGALIAVPLLAVFKIACDQVASLQPISVLLGQEP